MKQPRLNAVSCAVAGAIAMLLCAAASAHHEAFKASQVIGETLHNPSGESIGEVSDLVIAEDDVLSAVISVGGTLGVGDRLVAIPATELQFSHDDETWFVEMTQVELERLPEFDAKTVLGGMADHVPKRD